MRGLARCVRRVRSRRRGPARGGRLRAGARAGAAEGTLPAGAAGAGAIDRSAAAPVPAPRAPDAPASQRPKRPCRPCPTGGSRCRRWRASPTRRACSAPRAKAQLEAKLAAFEQAKGSQIAVIVVPSTQPEPISDFTNRVGDAWKIGRKGVGDGVLIAVAVKDRRVWISVARALEGAIPDVVATRITRELMGPQFARGDFAAGIDAGVDAVMKRSRARRCRRRPACRATRSTPARTCSARWCR